MKNQLCFKPIRELAVVALACLCIAVPLMVDAQSTSKPDVLVVRATGTGQTTGHVADLTITNNSKVPVTVQEQYIYIPSDGHYQPYVVIIPATIILPGQTLTIPLYGYCADVHTPPVPEGNNLAPIETWITTTQPGPADPTANIYPVVTTVVPPFTSQDIPGIITTPGYKPGSDSHPTGTISTWPGTDIPVDGTIDPVGYPEKFAPVIIEAIDLITASFDSLHEAGSIHTPFSGDTEKERESVIQQTFWIYMADVTGDRYQKPDFQGKVEEQFQASTGMTVTALPEEEKEKLAGGVEAFWSVFVLVGTEAKVISNETSPGTPETPVPVKQEIPVTQADAVPVKKDGCSLEEKVTDTGPKLDYAIADTGTKGKNEKVKEAFRKAIEEVAGLISDAQGSDTIDVGFTTPDMPASAWSLYFPHVVAGQANASAMVVDMHDPLNSAWTTQPLQTKADGSHKVVLTHITGPQCKSTLIGVNFAKVRASSGLKASLGSIEALRVINFVGEIAIDIIISKGKGTYTKLSKYLAEKAKDMAEEAAKEYIKEQIEKFSKEWADKSPEEAEQSMDELLKEIKDGPQDPDETEEAEAFLDDWLGAMLEEGDEFDPMDKIEGDLIDEIDSPIDWAPIKTNTYAIGEGSLDVYVDGDHGLAKAASGVRYKRVELEDAKDAEKGGGVFCDEGIASKTTSGTITLKTVGNTGSWAGASGEGIFSTGHGIAVSSLESFNGMYVIAICECPDATYYNTYSSVTGYASSENMTGIWASLFDHLMQDVADQLDKDISKAPGPGKRLPEGTAAKVQKGLEDAAKRAAQSILPCGKE